MGVKPVSVSALNNYIKKTITGDPVLGNIVLTGEISYWKSNARTGAVFFTVKDAQSQIDCVMWAPAAGRITIDYEVGMMVNLHGKVDYWNNRGQLRFNAFFIEPAGEGELNAKYEKLKEKLMMEGIFSPERKKPLPVFPKTVTVITSPEGSAAWDIKKTITEKNNYVDILVYPVKVQGQGAAEEISAALDAVNASLAESKTKTDVIILARGGGSPEERWAFNEEIVVRSISASRIPVITGIGHEDNESLSDLAADYYAKTPTAAADRAVPDTAALKEDILLRYEMMDRHFQRYISNGEEKVINLSPSRMVGRLRSKAMNEEQKCRLIVDRSAMIAKNMITEREKNIEILFTGLTALSPKNIMEKGYSVIRDKNGRMVSDISRINVSDIIDITVKNGKIVSEVKDIRSTCDD